MDIPESLLAVDRTRLFADWGVSILYRQVNRTIVPALQTVTESFVDTNVTAVMNAQSVTAAPNTIANDPQDRLSVLIQTAELPNETVSLTDQLVVNEIPHRILTAAQSPDGHTWHLTAQRT